LVKEAQIPLELATVLSIICWFCRHVKCKNYKVMEDSTNISREGLGIQTMYCRVRVSAGSH
jgi:hypothetical protein